MESKRSKNNTISKWRCSGVVYNDFDELYYIYIRTLKCCACNKEFKNSYERCLDHDHETGLFRAIVCRGCNVYDRYIKYPDGYDKKKWLKEYREANKEKITEEGKIYRENNKEKIVEKNKKYREKNKEKINKKYDCECGGKYINSHKQNHLKTIKHTAWFMEQVD